MTQIFCCAADLRITPETKLVSVSTASEKEFYVYWLFFTILLIHSKNLCTARAA